MNNIVEIMKGHYSPELLEECDKWLHRPSYKSVKANRNSMFLGRYETLPTDLTGFELGDQIVVGNTVYVLEGMLYPSLELNPYIEKRWGVLQHYDIAINNDDYSEDEVVAGDLSMVI